jgi:carbonic anhydrase
VKKLIQGIVQFRETRREELADTFSKLALGQHPDALFIACSDSRMAVNVFASTEPGDLFVLRNVGNLVPPYDHPGAAGTAAAVDFAVERLAVRDIIVCGHSDCGAMRAHCAGHAALENGPLKTWLDMAATGDATGLEMSEASRRNVLEQVGHLKQYPSVRRAIESRGLRLHGLWFDIRPLDVLYYEFEQAAWTVIDSASAHRILNRL